MTEAGTYVALWVILFVVLRECSIRDSSGKTVVE